MILVESLYWRKSVRPSLNQTEQLALLASSHPFADWLSFAGELTTTIFIWLKLKLATSFICCLLPATWDIIFVTQLLLTNYVCVFVYLCAATIKLFANKQQWQISKLIFY